MNLVERLKSAEPRTLGTIFSIGFLGTLALGATLNLISEPNKSEEKGPVKTLISKVVDEDPEDIRNGLTKDEENFLVKILYFEAINEDGGEAVAHVIRNRYIFDNCSPESLVKNFGCRTLFGGDKGLVGVASYKDPKKDVHQFSCIDDHPKYFLGEGLTNMEGLDAKKVTKMRRALNAVLTGESKDPTEGALYYKNTSLTNRIQGEATAWHGSEGFVAKVGMDNEACDYIEIKPKGPNDEKVNMGDAECRVDFSFKRDWTADIDGHQFYTVTPEATETVFSEACKYIDGEFSAKGSSGKYCRYLQD